MTTRRIQTLLATLALALLWNTTPAAAGTDDSELLATRETVWRAWFVNDTGTLAKLVPPDTLVISAGEPAWKHQAEVFKSAEEFQAAGGKLLRLEFPRTEVQHFGNVAIVWSSYLVETETKGKRSTSSGRVTEIFVRRNGHWTNPGWHTDAEK
ncbi:MAG: nuclear transport factor 2 family protein [Paludibaculum sp.]